MPKSLATPTCLMLLLILFLSNVSFGQNMPDLFFVVNQPASLAGNYGLANSNPANPPCGSMGELALYQDADGNSTGCGAAANDLNGKIALIDRADCSFDEKGINAEAAGAIAVIICNDNMADPDEIFNFTVAPGAFTIPMVMASLNTCQIFKAVLPELVTGSFDCNLPLVDTIGGPLYVYGCPDSNLTVCLALDSAFADPNNLFQWFGPNGLPLTPAPSPDSCFVFMSLDTTDEGLYTVEITNPNSPGQILVFDSIVLQLFLFDSAGTKYFPDQAVIWFGPDADEPYREDLRDTFLATKLAACICDSLELWRLLDGIVTSGTDMLIDLESKVCNLDGKTKIEEAGLNYLVVTNAPGSGIIRIGQKNQQMPVYEQLELAPAASLEDDTVLVAVVDVGIDIDHTDLANLIYQNPNETSTPGDDDGNCQDDDFNGYDFVGDDNVALETSNSHATHVAGIIKQVFVDNLPGPTSTRLELLNVRTHQSDGSSGVYDVTCGIYYAYKQNADIINCSWGYVGSESEIMKRSIKQAGLPNDATSHCGSFIVTSAGNEKNDNDLTPHWPSNFSSQFNHLIGVAAVDSTTQIMDSIAASVTSTGFSNFGQVVDLAARGIFDSDAASPIVGNSNKEIKEGTSMAAANVSGAAAVLFAVQPGLSPSDVKTLLKDHAFKNSLFTSLVESGNLLFVSRSIQEATAFTPSPCQTGTSDPLASLLPASIFPNPFSSGGLYIGYILLEKNRNTTLVISDPSGREIHRADLDSVPGEHFYYWNGKGSSGQLIPPGIYFLTIKLDGKPAFSGKFIKL
ncbi:MAG: S8 family serine peptidase [Saprospiraceae bacterium]